MYINIKHGLEISRFSQAIIVIHNHHAIIVIQNHHELYKQIEE